MANETSGGLLASLLLKEGIYIMRKPEYFLYEVGEDLLELEDIIFQKIRLPRFKMRLQIIA